MSLRDSLLERARKTAIRRRRSYGIEPSSKIDALLSREIPALTKRESFFLARYILFHSPMWRLRLFWGFLSDRDTPQKKRDIRLLAQDLRLRLSAGSRVVSGYFERRNCSRDLARVPGFMEKLLFRTTPLLVVQPGSEEDIVLTMSFCSDRGIPVFPRGSASFAFGGAVPTRNGLVLDLSPLMAVLDVDPENHTVRVQPGARWADVASRLEPFGLVPVTSPTSRFSTVAGWISTGGLGLDSFAFGSVYKSVNEVRVVRPDGSIEILTRGSEEIEDLFGTEGQLGILTEITLKARPRPQYSGACLLPFEDSGEAINFLCSLAGSEHRPSHAVFFDVPFLARENALFTDHGVEKSPIVPEKNSVLLHFETEESERLWLASLNGASREVEENRLAARFLWSDRYFPLKAQRLGPGLLGAEVVVPADGLKAYLFSVRKRARKLGIDTSVEIILCRNEEKPLYLVMVSFPCDYSRPFHYSLSLLLIQLLVRSAVRAGGYPYGIGIWNTPFVGAKFSQARLRALRRKKHQVDPRRILNPGKFFRVKGRFFGLTAFFFRPSLFRAVLGGAGFFWPLLGILGRVGAPEKLSGWSVPSREEDEGELLLSQSAARCASCGACVSVCPAYHITGEELVTGRSKLRLSGAAFNGKKGEGISRKEAHSVFQCLQCGLCEEVCQTRLPLRECYLALEDSLERRFGSPEETVRRFVEQLDGKRDLLRNVFGLDFPEWNPETNSGRMPSCEAASGGDGR